MFSHLLPSRDEPVPPLYCIYPPDCSACPPAPLVWAAASASSHAAQSFDPPSYGIIAFDSIPLLHKTSQNPEGTVFTLELPGTYLFSYGVRVSTGVSGVCTLGFASGDIDEGARIPLVADTMVSGSAIRRLVAGEGVSLRLEAATPDAVLSLPQAEMSANAYLTIARIGDFPIPTAAES